MTTKTLTDKQRKFIDAYFSCGLNATEAAREAGYSDKTARSIGSENLTKPDIRQEIDRRLAESTMKTDEILARLSSMARGDIGEFLDVMPNGHAMFNLDRAREAGMLHLIKKYKVTRQGVELELHDPQRALELLGKHHKLFNDKIEVDWRVKLEAAGISASELFEQLVRARATSIRDGTG